jgi:hypothetical protein
LVCRTTAFPHSPPWSNKDYTLDHPSSGGWDFGLKLRFQGGGLRRVNLQDHLGGTVFAALKDPRLFRTARLNPDIDTVVWDDGPDMSPDFLHEISTPA